MIKEGKEICLVWGIMLVRSAYSAVTRKGKGKRGAAFSCKAPAGGPWDAVSIP